MLQEQGNAIGTSVNAQGSLQQQGMMSMRNSLNNARQHVVERTMESARFATTGLLTKH